MGGVNVKTVMKRGDVRGADRQCVVRRNDEGGMLAV
jgi:hypothetical protein